ncbi:MAG: antibiotic biosynthesis monooxygenase [Nitrososphaeraceae archaeon]|nr:antibiotic biosynthesis monooxygenase [Nitrososphaeraceae archaeon]
MVEIVEMDDKITLNKQLDENIGPVILINKFNLDPEDVNQFLEAWASDAEIMKQQPGFILTQLHRGVANSGTFINYAVWESTPQFKRALNNPQFQAKLSDYPASMVASPHLFSKVAVQGICVE